MTRNISGQSRRVRGTGAKGYATTTLPSTERRQRRYQILNREERRRRLDLVYEGADGMDNAPQRPETCEQKNLSRRFFV